MKKFTLLLIFAVLISCSNDDKDVSSKNNLNGRWNWILTSGGFGGGSLTPEKLNQTMIIEFSGTSLKTYINDNLSKTQKFSIQSKPSIFGGKRKVIVIDKGNSDTAEAFLDQSFEIIGKKLYLRQECVDCSTSEYERIK
ncbi:hypothetical protein [Flavobacterium salmonis]|uniref:Lipocalin-like domain-containing protein n=1 Tax=Flavobacterium salmonis TaxID=2654844 RepID=A0A6V6Z1N7_9FLAO|nr:hypothetical protein [Flavobacterium salmonis]CAD0005585.1 hypothetical protein FLAT13_02860 [Flavobacterium salmonis]